MIWMKHVLLAILILIIAGIVLYLNSTRMSEVRPDGAPAKSIADSMSNFYSDYKLTSRDPLVEDMGDFVLRVKTPQEPLANRLKKMERLQKPASGRWVGEHKHRSFKSGSTLRSAITDYAVSEGMQVIWELDQDFIIKHTFQLDDSILGSLRMIATAIDANFDGEVKAYMCPKQRSLVITENSTAYLKKYCALARR
ncbi:toxin co-regulated pilus biosynthesis Q family protein [Paraglaciecola sp.]|uniref:toxin co-regulated pilus biosynthesis Q family protein n=1 Tax=Paraglaciecola sp. TaxID=1920173 RepID=UPI003EF5E40A